MDSRINYDNPSEDMTTNGQHQADAAERAARKASDREEAGSRAKFVTRPAEFTNSEDNIQKEPRVLLHGIDTLDLGLFVRWDKYWPKVSAELVKGKRNARGTQGILFGDGRCVILPSGKPPIYCWHLVYPQFHLFISKHQQPKEKTPNVFVSINSETLWHQGIQKSLELVSEQIKALRGELTDHVVSRCDPCVDLIIPDGLTYEFIQKHRVPANRKTHIYEDNQLETYYAGAAGADIQLRIYDKSLEINQQFQKSWFLDLWGVKTCKDIWRIEYQLRREVLRQFEIRTIYQLEQKLPGIWHYLTEAWFSLRLQDNKNSSRRTIHPLWELVNASAECFGTIVDAQRELTAREQKPAWYVSHIAGCLLAYAVCKQKSDQNEALEELTKELQIYFQKKNFTESYQVRSIKAGLTPEQKEAA